MPLARARGARQLRVTRGDAGDPGAARTPSSSKENPGLPRLGWVLAKPYASRALWLLCGCSWQAPAGSRRAPEAAQPRAGTAGCVGGCWGGAHGDWHLSPPSPVPVVPGLAGTLQRGRAGADPRPRELFPQETAAVCPHIAPALAQSCAGHGALQPGQPNPWMASGWMVDAPGRCCSWPGPCGIPDPASGIRTWGQPRYPGCELLWVPTHLSARSGCPCATWRAEGTDGLVPVPIPWSSSRAVAWKIAGVDPRPGAEQSPEQIFPVV